MGLTFTEKCASTDPEVLEEVGLFSEVKLSCVRYISTLLINNRSF